MQVFQWKHKKIHSGLKSAGLNLMWKEIKGWTLWIILKDMPGRLTDEED